MAKETRYTYRMDEEFHRQLRIKVAERGLRTVSDAIDIALTDWMDLEPAPNPRGNQDATKAEQKWLNKLLRLLRTGHPKAVAALKHNIDAFELTSHALNERDDTLNFWLRVVGVLRWPKY